jgi:ferredoxin, 2Fe-2S
MQDGGAAATAPELKFNGEKIEARPGETLVQAARRHGSNVWFFCDGRGICQTCECRVVSGGANLSEPTDLERAGLSAGRRRRGYRLGCQARLAGPGAVSVVSRAEELRRRLRDVLAGAREQRLWERLRSLGDDTLSATVEVASGVALVAPFAIPQLIEQPPTPTRIAEYARDTMRLAGTLLRGG